MMDQKLLVQKQLWPSVGTILIFAWVEWKKAIKHSVRNLVL